MLDEDEESLDLVPEDEVPEEVELPASVDFESEEVSLELVDYVSPDDADGVDDFVVVGVSASLGSYSHYSLICEYCL